MDKQKLLGKVFISHSSQDDLFVEQLSIKLEEKGYATWLDDKELLPGDYLPTTIGKAIETSKVSILVLSKHSIYSEWIKYEINNVLERKIRGQIRLIPALIDDVNLPPELNGLIFADFRDSFDEGVNKVIEALNHEADIYLLRRISEKPFFKDYVENALITAFDSIHEGGISSEYKALSYKWVNLNGFEVLYEIESDFGIKRPLSINWWNEFSEVMLYWGIIRFIMVITERPIGFVLEDSITLDNPIIGNNSRVLYKHLTSLYSNLKDIDVLIIDFSKITNQQEYLPIFIFVKDYFTKLI